MKVDCEGERFATSRPMLYTTGSPWSSLIGPLSGNPGGVEKWHIAAEYDARPLSPASCCPASSVPAASDLAACDQAASVPPEDLAAVRPVCPHANSESAVAPTDGPGVWRSHYVASRMALSPPESGCESRADAAPERRM